MKWGFLLVLVLMATSATGKVVTQPQSVLDLQVDGRITNGNTASLGQFPHIVRLMTHTVDNMYAVCTGSLIGQEWIVTAAHCVDGLGDIHAYLGAINHYSPEVSFSVPNSNSIVHPDWNSSNLHNDIALVKIPAVTYSNRVQSIKLPSYSAPLYSYADDQAVISGWGATYDGSPLPDNLQYANVDILSQEECSKKLDLIDSMICTSTTSSAICGGDSGGPLVSSNILVGVTSFGVGRCDSGYPAGFMRITSFLWWIKKNTGISY